MPKSWIHGVNVTASAAALSLLLAAGCENKTSDGDAKPADPKPAATAAAPAKAPPAASSAAPNPADPGPAAAKAPASGQTDASKYPMTSFRPVADNCSNANVLLTSSPQTPPPKWTFIRAALAAHREFKVDGSGPDGVSFQMAPTSDNKAVQLIASCRVGTTCNRLAATYKAVVPSSKPQVYCGEVPGVKAQGRAIIEATIPAAGAEAIEKCARIGVCMRAMDPSGSGDPGLECQKSPTSFKLDCASKPTCADVVNCAK
jgi:hypothetical protein